MKAVEILTEETSSSSFAPRDIPGTGGDPVQIIKSIVSFIRANCQPWLSQTEEGQYYAYRGLYEPPKGFVAFRKNVRAQREPKDTDWHVHMAFNEIIAMCGKVANRSNAVFVTGDYELASRFGDVFVAVPIGDFKYTWHDKEEDWTGWFEAGDFTRQVSIDPEDIEVPDDKMREIERHAAERSRERGEEGEGYYYGHYLRIGIEDYQFKKSEELLNEPDPYKVEHNVCPHLHGDDGSLIDALESRKEVMVACREVLIIDSYIYRHAIKDLLKLRIPVDKITDSTIGQSVRHKIKIINRNKY